MIKTEDLPVGSRPPLIYKAAFVFAEVQASPTSGEPNINITLQATGAASGKRFDGIYLKKHWFEPDFNQLKIQDTKERNLFYMSVGQKGRPGKIINYLGDGQLKFESVEQITQLMNKELTGKTFWVIQRQRVEKETGIPTNKYNLQVSQNPPEKVAQNAVWLDKPEGGNNEGQK